jgi:hypothetical protein
MSEATDSTKVSDPLAKRAERLAALTEIHETAIRSFGHLESLISGTAAGLGAVLNVSATQMLCEPGLDPTIVMEEAKETHASAKRLLDKGVLSGAQAMLDETFDLIELAHELVEDAQESVETHAEMRGEIDAAAKALRDKLDAHLAAIKELPEDHFAKVRDVRGAVEALLATAEGSSAASERMFREGRVIGAADLLFAAKADLERAAATLATVVTETETTTASDTAPARARREKARAEVGAF